MTGPGSDPASENETVVLRMHAAGEQVFDRYRLIRQLGRGGMGIVWLVHDDELDEDIALKFLPELLASDRAAVDDLRRETRRSRELTHPHIIRVHDFLRNERTAAIAMEFVDGDTLSNLRLTQPAGVFEPLQLGPWVGQLTDALDYAHERARIVHRDLKAANLMIDRRGDLKVADFGISATVSETVTRVSRTSTSGTPVYMSPQQMRGAAPSPSDDIYSLGATMFELLTGKPPFFRGDISHQVINVPPPTIAQRRAEFGLPSNPVPQIWEDTIACCLAKEPELRPASAGAVAAALGLAPGARPTVDVTSRSGLPVVPGAPPTHPSTHGSKPSGTTAPGVPPPPPAQRKSTVGLYAAIGAVAVALVGVAFYLGVHLTRSAHRTSQPGSEPAEISRIATPAEPNGGLSQPSSVPSTPVGTVEQPPFDAVPATIQSSPSTTYAQPPTSSSYDAPVAVSGGQEPAPSAPPMATAPTDTGSNSSSSGSAKPSTDQTFWTPPVASDDKPSPGAQTSAPDATTAPITPPEPTKPTANARGGVIIESEPSGAEVFFGGYAHDTTPARFRDLRVGDYRVVVRKAGYNEWSRDVTVEEDRFANVHAVLVRSTGTLQVNSVPSGLAFVVNGGGRTERGTTPAVLTNLPVGSYTVQVSREGWAEQRLPAQVESQRTAAVIAEFDEGTISFTSRPAGASVRVTGGSLDHVAFNNDKGQESVTPFLGRLKPGEYEVEFSMAGYDTTTQRVTVEAKQTVNATAQLKQRRERQALASFSIPDMRMDMVWLAPGRFTMGSPDSEALREKDEGPLTDVTLTNGFWISSCEVTYAQWQAVMGGAAVRTRGTQPTDPVSGITWDEAMAYCRRLTDRERSANRLPAGYAYTLPTEAQWEFACRAGSTAPYAGTGRVEDMGWCVSNSRGQAHTVGSKQPNAWGLYDMHGNVSEWCLDIFTNQLPGGSVTNPEGPQSGSTRVLRGGNWSSYTMFCRSADRVGAPPNERKSTTGFRVALSRAP